MSIDDGRSQPNIVFILVDDLGWRDLGVQGSTFYETPHLDRLAAQGTQFSDAYAASPVCSPTRASILTGKYPVNVGVTQFIGGHGVGALTDVAYRWYLPLQEFSLARALRAGGYRTWHVGKWHLGPRRTWPDQHGFDINIGGCDWGFPPSYTSPYGCPTLTDGPDGEYLTDRLTDEAIRLIEESDDDQPFFLNLWHYAVHIPLAAPAELVAKYEEKARALGLDEIDPFEDGESFPVWHQREARVVRRTIQSNPLYAAMIENLDTNIGRLLEALELRGVADNTIVMFTSDNGGLATAEGSPTSNAPLSEGKGWLNEGGIRVPFIVRWPDRVPAGRCTGVPITSPDLYPTLLSAAGLDPRPRQHADGRDILDVLEGGDGDRGPLLFHYPHYSNHGSRPSSAIRDGRWKLIHDWETTGVELFDLETDIEEKHDLSADHPDVVERLRTHLLGWVGEYPSFIPVVNEQEEAYPDLMGYVFAGKPSTPTQRQRASD